MELKCYYAPTAATDRDYKQMSATRQYQSGSLYGLNFDFQFATLAFQDAFSGRVRLESTSLNNAA
jgi:hypothetical protein